MKLTKYGHSCVLVQTSDETGDRAVLFDPGNWSDVPVEDLPTLDGVCISHGHPDHCDSDTLKRIVALQPDVPIVAPEEVVVRLRDEGLAGATTDAIADAELFVSPHEGKPPFMDPPDEIGIHYRDMYSHPGDSHSFSETKPVLGLPVQAPWGSMMNAILLAIELKPRYVLPLHDWHWHDEAREWAYGLLERQLEPHGITVLKPVDGVPIELN